MRYDAIGADVQVVNLAFESSAYIFVTVGKDSAGQAIVKVSEQRNDGEPSNKIPNLTFPFGAPRDAAYRVQLHGQPTHERFEDRPRRRLPLREVEDVND